MKRISLVTLAAIPLLWGCQSNDAKFDTDQGAIDARKLAKECVEMQKNNPKKFRVSASPFCDDWDIYEYCTGCENEKTARKVVRGYMKLYKQGINISKISPDQASGDKVLDLESEGTGKMAKEKKSRSAPVETYCWFGDTERICIEKQDLNCEANRSGSVNCSAKGEWSGKDPGDTRYYNFGSWRTNDEYKDALFNSMLCFHKGNLSNKNSPTCSAARYYGLL